MTDTTELTASVETALKAFNEYKGLVEGIKTKLRTDFGRQDGRLRRGQAGRPPGEVHRRRRRPVRQKEQAARKAEAQAIEAKQRELEAELSGMKTALNRPGSSGRRPRTTPRPT